MAEQEPASTIQTGDGPTEPAVTIERESIETPDPQSQVRQHDGPLQDDAQVAQSRETLVTQTADILASDVKASGLLDLIRRIRQVFGSVDLDKLIDLLDLIAKFQAIEKPWDEAGISERLQAAMKIMAQVAAMTPNTVDDRMVAGARALFDNEAVRLLVASLLARLLSRVAPSSFDVTSQSIGDVAVGDELDNLMAQASIDWPTLVNLIRFAWELFLKLRK